MLPLRPKQPPLLHAHERRKQAHVGFDPVHLHLHRLSAYTGGAYVTYSTPTVAGVTGERLSCPYRIVQQMP